MAKKGKRDKRKQRAEGADAIRPHAASAPAGPVAAASVDEGDERAPAAGGSVGPITPAAASSTTSGAAPVPRALANALILAFLAYNVAMPMRYYLGGRGTDERFSWRMFSTVRMQRCRVKVMETVDGSEQRLDLQKELQIAWNGMLERYRRPVVDKLLARRCVKAKASRVVFTRSCTDTDGSALPDDVVSLDCKSGELVATANAARDDAEDAP